MLGLRRRRSGLPLGAWLGFRCLRNGRQIFRHPRLLVRPRPLDLHRLVVHEHQGFDPIAVSEFFRDLGLVRGFDLNIAPFSPHDVEIPINVQQVTDDRFRGFG